MVVSLSSELRLQRKRGKLIATASAAAQPKKAPLVASSILYNLATLDTDPRSVNHFLVLRVFNRLRQSGRNDFLTITDFQRILKTLKTPLRRAKIFDEISLHLFAAPANPTKLEIAINELRITTDDFFRLFIAVFRVAVPKTCSWRAKPRPQGFLAPLFAFLALDRDAKSVVTKEDMEIFPAVNLFFLSSAPLTESLDFPAFSVLYGLHGASLGRLSSWACLLDQENQQADLNSWGRMRVENQLVETNWFFYGNGEPETTPCSFDRAAEETLKGLLPKRPPITPQPTGRFGNRVSMKQSLLAAVESDEITEQPIPVTVLDWASVVGETPTPPVQRSKAASRGLSSLASKYRMSYLEVVRLSSFWDEVARFENGFGLSRKGLCSVLASIFSISRAEAEAVYNSTTELQGDAVKFEDLVKWYKLNVLST